MNGPPKRGDNPPHVDTNAQARQLGARLQTESQARDAVALTLAILRRAVDALGGFPTVAKLVGLHAAYASRIEQQITRLGDVGKRPFNRQTANAIGLAVVQAAELLGDLRRDVRQTQAESTINNLADEFARALREILETVGRAVVGAIPWWVWAGLLLWSTDRESRRPRKLEDW